MPSAIKKPKPYLLYAIDANGKPVHIDSVSNGFSCGCICPHCNSELQAKNGGNERAHHFAHKNGADCRGAVESAIHCLAKEILKESLCVMLPDNAGELRFDKVETERYFPDLKLRPDCVGYYGGKSLWIEFKRSHEVDPRKAGKIFSARIDCIEIDLRDCEQDKEKLREFITQSSKKRKWIYSSEHGVGLQERANYDRNTSKQDDFELESAKLERHFAINDDGKLIDLRVPSEFDAINHSYYCPYCGKEVVLMVNGNGRYTFDHIDENVPCDDEMYLRAAAVAAIQKAFENSEKFLINVPQSHSCNQADKCPCRGQECQISTTQQYDLKSHHFFKCVKDYKFSDVSYRTDLVFYREDILKNPIEVRVNTENFELEHETSRRLIEVSVFDENDVCRLEQGLNNYKLVRFSGFQESKRTVNPIEIQHEILKYTIYSSGKIHIGALKCTDLHTYRNSLNVIREGVFTKTNGLWEDMYIFLLLHYGNLQKEVCRCQLCWSLKKSNGRNNDYICVRYKNVGTPKTPLREKIPPRECPYFKADFNILKREKELNEEIEIVEL